MDRPCEGSGGEDHGATERVAALALPLEALEKREGNFVTWGVEWQARTVYCVDGKSSSPCLGGSIGQGLCPAALGFPNCCSLTVTFLGPRHMNSSRPPPRTRLIARRAPVPLAAIMHRCLGCYLQHPAKLGPVSVEKVVFPPCN
jgi:hypothetical protein